MTAETSTATARVEAHEAIRANLYLYAQGVDRRDWDAVRASYHSDAHDDHGSYKGDVDGLIDWLARRHAVIRSSMHFIGNIKIECLSDEVAVVDSYCMAFQRYGPEAGETRRAWLGDADTTPDVVVDATLGGRYVDVVERRAGAWKVFDRAVTFEFISAVPAPEVPIDDSFLVSRRDRLDALYVQREAALKRLAR